MRSSITAASTERTSPNAMATGREGATVAQVNRELPGLADGERRRACKEQLRDGEVDVFRLACGAVFTEGDYA
jgi:hypothetical protein